jgi:hypothetical protein
VPSRFLGAKAIEGVESLDRSPDEPSGVGGAERTDGDDGNWGGPSPARRLRSPPEDQGLITGVEPGSRRCAGMASEAAVVPLEPDGQHNRR